MTRRFPMLAAALTGAMLLSTAACQAGDRPWIDFVGAQDRTPDWAGLVRGIGRGATGVNLVDKRTGALMTPEESPKFQRFRQRAERALASGRTMIVPVGGLGSGRKSERVDPYMNGIEADGGKAWRAKVRAQVLALADLPGMKDRLYWQVGNEINSRHMTETLRAWSNRPGPNSFDDEIVIPYYVEYLLAPTVEELRAVYKERFGTDRANIVLGTIANAYRPSSRRWMDKLLDTRIEGRFAPSLKGQRVVDVVEIVAMHYLISQDARPWAKTLDTIHQRWRGQGRVRGIWSTEEIGRKRARNGFAAATGLKVAARYLTWTYERKLSPEQARANFWGWDRGPENTTGNDGLTALHDFLGTVPLRPLPGVVGAGGKAIEWFGFGTAAGDKRVVIGAALGKRGKTKVTEVTLPAGAWSNPGRGQARIFTAKGNQVLPVTVARQGANLVVRFSQPAVVPAPGTLLITLNSAGQSG